jgi:hypothetical protein
VKICNEYFEVHGTEHEKSSSKNERGICLGGWVVQGSVIRKIFISRRKGGAR